MIRYAPRSQRGSSLFVVMIILLAIAFFALSSFRITGQHLMLVGNHQGKMHVAAAAQRGIEQTISSNAFSLDPPAVAATPIVTDIDNDGTDDFTATLDPVPKCHRVRPIKTSELDLTKVADRVCLMSSGSGSPFVEIVGGGVASGDSLCAVTEWDVTAKVTDNVTNAKTQISQGVSIRAPRSDADNFCK
jgi:hypothetical protein